jgi:hypothetical protein
MLFLRKILTVFLVLLLLVISSCNTKRDCRGHIKHKLPNGIWM